MPSDPFNDISALQRDGKLAAQTKSQLQSFRATCFRYLNAHGPIARDLIAAIDEEIRQKDVQEADESAAQRHQAALAHDQLLHGKTQIVAWIAVGFAAIGVLVGVASCLSSRLPPTRLVPMSVSQHGTSAPPSQSSPQPKPTPTLPTLTNISPSATSAPPKP